MQDWNLEQMKGTSFFCDWYFQCNASWIWPHSVILKNINITEENRLVIFFKIA